MKLKSLLHTTLLATISLAIGGHAAAGETLAAIFDQDDGEAADEASDPTEKIDEWAELDQELRGLDILDVDYRPMAEIWGYGRVLLVDTKVGDQTGTFLDYVRVNATGEFAGVNYRITADFATGNAVLTDAWMSKQVVQDVNFTIGLFRTPFLRSGLVEARDLLFTFRTRNGVFYSRRNRGVMFNGHHGKFHWAAALQNGYLDENTDNRSLTSVRTSVDLIGGAPLPWEGAYQSESTTHLSLGAAFSQDHTVSNGAAAAVEANFVHKGMSLQAEYLDYGADYSNAGLPLADRLEQRGSTSPFSITASYMLSPDKYELAVRYDDFDDRRTPFSYQRRTFSVGINRYLLGHNLKWQLNYSYAHKGGGASAPVNDGPPDALVGLGITASF